MGDLETGLAGQAAIVTGGASGIGKACASALAAEGANVVVADLDGAAAEAAAREISPHCVGVKVDVTSPDDCRRMVAEATTRWDRLDVLVTCAGVFSDTPLDTITVDEWDR
ncbi:MAG: SDR family NAD(P)-dependent oxidoreductase, partial [Actinobacteria bacterium]|nr:SDR family NAD(P)-dependent oxidoreductase [Actinomycetota bacterium]